MNSIAIIILAPMLWGAIALALPPRLKFPLVFAGLLLGCFSAIQLMLLVSTEGAFTYAVGSWSAPLGIDLKVDGLAVSMLLLTQIISLIAALYAQLYLKQQPRQLAYFWPLLGFLLCGLNALFLSADLFNLYVTLEVVGLAAVSLVALTGKRANINAALRYLIATLLGSGLYLLGTGLIYGLYGTVSIELLAELIENPDQPALLYLKITIGLIIVGLMFKAALWPLHYWLPPAHGGAMPAVSALLSALVVKAAFYIVLRLWLELFGSLAALATPLLFGLGAAAILLGSWRAIQADELKRVVAYSTVAQVGYLFLALPLLSTVAQPPALQAISMQMIAHGTAKAAMFMAAGILVLVSAGGKIAQLQGSASRQPLAMFAFALAGVSLIGLPPSGGFIAKWYLLTALIESGFWPLVAVVLAGGLMAAWYVFRVINIAFTDSPDEASDNTLITTNKPQQTMAWLAMLLALAAIALGFCGQPLADLIATGAAS